MSVSFQCEWSVNPFLYGRPARTYFRPVVSSSFFLLLLSFFLVWSQRSQSGCLPYFYARCGLSENLERRSEMCCTRLAIQLTQKNDAKMGHHRTTLSGWVFATKACIDNRKKIVKQQYLHHRSSQYGELRPISGWDRFGSLEHPNKFQPVSRVGFVTAATSFPGGQPNCARCLAVS